MKRQDRCPLNGLKGNDIQYQEGYRQTVAINIVGNRLRCGSAFARSPGFFSLHVVEYQKQKIFVRG